MGKDSLHILKREQGTVNTIEKLTENKVNITDIYRCDTSILTYAMRLPALVVSRNQLNR